MGLIKIISDGTPQRTKVYLDGMLIDNVVAVSWSIENYQSLARAVIIVDEVAVNVQGEKP